MPKRRTPNIKIQELETGQFGVFFAPDAAESSLDGHTWSQVIQTYCSAKNMSLDGVMHDPESDMYSAVSSETAPLEQVVKAIEALTSNSRLLAEWISVVDRRDDRHDDDDDMTTKEFLEWMVEAGYNMSKPTTFKFDLEGVKDLDHAKPIQLEIEKQGHGTKVELVDEDVYFQLVVKLVPSLNEVLKLESYLESVAKKFGARYIGFGV